MNIKEQIKLLLQEADLYRSQSLLNESIGKYKKAVELIQKNVQIKNKQNLIDVITKKIRAVENDLDKINKAPPPEVSSKIQDLIINKFAFSGGEASVLEGVIALARFGQYERALKEFNNLIKNDSLRMVAAKNVIRCHIALNAIEDAVSQFQQWLSSDIFTPTQLNKLRVFLGAILEKKGSDITLSQVKGPAVSGEPEMEEPEIEEDEIIDINSIGITLESGPKKGQMVELGVSFQSGNVISVLISSKDKELIASLKVGTKLNNVQYFSPIAMFNGQGVVSDLAQIESGPRRGDYNLDIKVINT